VQYGIGYLADVRSCPYSKFNPDFNKEALKRVLTQKKIKYLFMGDQIGGLPDDLTCRTDDKIDYDKCKQNSRYIEGITRLVTAYQKNLKVAMMCSESKPQECHRSKLLGEMLRDRQVTVQHIDETGLIVIQLSVINLLDKGQPALFGEVQGFISRKKYGVGGTHV
jgi:uncharacterized protein (DUF488 family)